MGPLRLVLQRAAASWPLLCAAFVTVLVAATLIAAIPIYSEAVALAGLERSLESAPVSETSIEVSGFLDQDGYASADREVTQAVRQAVAATGAEVYRGGRSESFALSGHPRGTLAVFGFLEGIERHARLIAGDWPEAGALEAALSEPAARLLGFSAGDVATVARQRGAEERLDVHVSGVYRIGDPEAAFWRADALELEGVVRGDFTTYGPFVVSRETFFELARGTSRMRWRVAPRFDELGVDELAELRAGLAGLERSLSPEDAGPGALEVDTGLGKILEEAERSLLVARSGVLVPSLQLAILAAYALLFTAFLIAEERRVETALLQARGADWRRAAAVALLEGMLLAVPAALLGPWLAAFSLRLLNRFGPLAEVDLGLDPRVGVEAYALAAAAAVACVAALVVPAVRSQRVALVVAQTGRPPEQGFVQRVRLDVVLLALALLAYWQLRRYGGALIEDAQGRLGIDPFLIAAPALGLLAGAVLALRAVPALTRLGERFGAPARGVVGALGTRQLARRPRGYARSALLLTLALAIGLFAVSYGSTWTRSQADQADYEAGADVRARPDERSGALPAVALPRAYETIPAVRGALPQLTESFDLPDAAGSLVAVDAERAPQVVSLRGDLARAPTEELFRPLGERRAELAALPLPGEPAALALTVRGNLDTRARRFGFTGGVPGLSDVARLPPSLALVVRDAAGVLHWYRAGKLTRRDRARRFVVDLSGTGGRNEDVTPAYPLELVGIELGVVAPFLVPNGGTVEVQALDVRDPGGGWQSVGLDAASWTVLVPELPLAQSAPDGRVVQVGGTLVLSLATGSSNQDEVEVAFRLTPGSARTVDPLPALATDAFLEATGSRAGEVVPLELAGARRPVEITGVLEGFPTVPPDTAALVVDYESFGALSYLDGTVAAPEEWWLDVAPGRSEPVADRLAAPPFSSAEVESREARARALQNDPVAVGTIGALSLGFLAAAVFAAVGFAVSSAVSTRERATEFAVMRSLGLSSRQLTGWLVVESGVLILLSLAGGTALGLLLARFVLPSVSLTQTGEDAFPQPIVEIPWMTVAWLEMGLLVVLLLIVVLEVRLLRKIQLAAVLRAGEVR